MVKIQIYNIYSHSVNASFQTLYQFFSHKSFFFLDYLPHVQLLTLPVENYVF